MQPPLGKERPQNSPTNPHPFFPHPFLLTSRTLSPPQSFIHSFTTINCPCPPPPPAFTHSFTTRNCPWPPTFTHSFTTRNCPCPPLFRSIPLVPGPPCCLLCSLSRPLSISCRPASRTRSLCACCSGLAWKRLSTEELRVPRRVSPTPC